MTADSSTKATAEAVALVDGAVVELNGHIGVLRSEVEQMLAAILGETASSSAHVFDSFEQQAYKINSALRRMRDALVSADSSQV